MKCPNCQQDQWIEGKLGAAHMPVPFVPDHHKFLNVGFPGIAAFACGSCGYVRLSVDVEKLKSSTKE